MLLGLEALRFLEGKGFEVLKTELAKGAEEAAQVARGMGFPVTLKVSSPDAIHKSDIGGVKVNLKSEEEVRRGFNEILEAFRTQNPGGRIEGALVQEQGDGVEVIIGAITDRQFGPVLMFGLGGIFAEVMRDVTFRIIPIGRGDAQEMIREIRGYPILSGARGTKVNLSALEGLLLKVSRLIEDDPQIVEMDLNPVFLSEAPPRICDARIKLRGNA